MKYYLSIFSIVLSLFGASINYAGAVIPNPEATVQYWTPERLRDARPMALLKSNLKQTQQKNLSHHEETKLNHAVPPLRHLTPSKKQLFVPHPLSIQTHLDNGGLNEQFSSSQIVPNTSDVVYPYATVGKLFFTIPGQGNFYCSAAVISFRIVLTAGHCVHSGTAGSTVFYNNFLFVPASHNGTTPFLSWTSSFVTASDSWINGGGILPNASDIALLEIVDQNINGKVSRVGEVVGMLGWQTQSLSLNHVHSLGYPINFDGGNLMHQVSAQSGVPLTPNNFQIGSDMQTGSDGGPWIQNLGIASDGQSSGSNPNMNTVVGVTSMTASPAGQMGQSSSLLDDNFVALFNSICAHQANNCS